MRNDKLSIQSMDFAVSIINLVKQSKEYIKELHGTNRKKEIYTASVQGRGIIEQIRDANVVEDWDITKLGLGQAIIGLPGKAPFVFQFKKA